MSCLFCKSEKTTGSPYENTVFNQQEFQYLTCASCGLVYINPLPGENDFDRMYPVSYQGMIYTEPTGCYDWLFNQVSAIDCFKTLADYGCGNGKFITEAIDKGYQVTGVEYNPDLVAVLKGKIPKGRFTTLAEFHDETELYDIIFLGNVLEHLTDPAEKLHYFKSRLSEKGLLILEGPVEDNFTIAGAVRKAFFGMRKAAGYKVNHAPRHIFYSNYKNQLAMFNNAGFSAITYKVNEVSWPFPGTLNSCKSAKDYLYFIIAGLSKVIGTVIPRSGNVFYFIGRKCEKK